MMDSANSSDTFESQYDLDPEPGQQVAVEGDVMESADDVNLQKVGNCKMISDDTFLDQEVITNKYDNCESEDTNAKSKSSKVRKICHFDRLPTEIVEMIFYQYLSPNVRKSIRLVSKAWYQRSNRNENVTIDSKLNTRKTRQNLEYLNNCGFERPNLELLYLNINEICMPVLWGNIWRRIHSLSLSCCRLRDRAFEKIILHCDNLEFLQIILIQKDIDEAADFCTPSTLESLDCVQPKLKTLKIVQSGKFYVGKNACYFKRWERIFNCLVRIFPNVVHYGVSSINESHSTRLTKFEFSLQSKEISNRSHLAFSLANALFVEKDNFSWRSALDALSGSRLTAVSLALWKVSYTAQDKITLFKFFSCHRPLKFIELDLSCFPHEWSNFYEETVTRLIFEIVEFNPQLRTLQYFKNVEWLLRLPRTEFLRFCSILPKLEILTTDNLVLKSSSIWSSSSHGLCYRPHLFLKMISSSLHFVHQHFSLQECDDEIFQYVFQYLTNLETLRICFLKDVTNFGITGRGKNSHVGYSINRLRNLKRLKLTPRCEYQIDDEIFNEFDFPKLNHLECFMPKKFSTLVLLRQKLPSLNEVVFVRTMITFRRPINWDVESKVRLSSPKLKKLFAIFPMLKSISFLDRSESLFNIERPRKKVFRELNE